MSYSKIITHRGCAHRDEFIAICLLLSHIGCIVPVMRRDPLPDELQDPDTAIIDVGERHDPPLGNFDHHQYQHGDAALALVLRHIGVHDEAQALFPWVCFSNTLDTRGPVATAASYGMSQEAFCATLSPVEDLLLQQFAQMEEVEPWLLTLMKSMGDTMLSTIKETRQRLALLELGCTTATLGGLKVIISRIEEKPSLALEEFRRLHHPDAALSVYPDNRGDGWTIYRFDDDSRLDFSRLSSHAAVKFAHKNGFLLKTRLRLQLPELEPLIRAALT